MIARAIKDLHIFENFLKIARSFRPKQFEVQCISLIARAFIYYTITRLLYIRLHVYYIYDY